MPKYVPPPRRFVAGLDLGMVSDPSALIVAEIEDRPTGDVTFTPAGTGFNPVHVTERFLHVKGIKRFPLRTNYEDVIGEVALILRREPMRGATKLVLDGTGVGLACRSLAVKAGLNPLCISFTSGAQVTAPASGTTGVPKGDLVAACVLAFQQKRLTIIESPDADLLAAELLNYRARVTASRSITYAAAAGAKDDLLCGLLMTCWYAFKRDVPRGVMRDGVWGEGAMPCL